jgi:hypothetical protein
VKLVLLLDEGKRQVVIIVSVLKYWFKHFSTKQTLFLRVMCVNFCNVHNTILLYNSWNFVRVLCTAMGQDSSVGIATGYGLDDLGIESRWGRDFLHESRPPLGPIQPLYSGYRVFSRGKAGGRDADHMPPSSAKVTKGWSYTSIHPLGLLRPVTWLLYLYLYCVQLYGLLRNCGNSSSSETRLHVVLLTGAEKYMLFTACGLSLRLT